MKLKRRYVDKPWGRTSLPPVFDAPAGRRIGEVWFEGPANEPLLAKYLFTSERLSIQVHPNDEQARARGVARGKNECWYILDAQPGARIGLGLTQKLSRDELRAAAADGSIEHQMDWRPVIPGDFFAVPAGTIHAIGAGISLLEFQQNSDVTYRLYDYGRPRELHLDDALAVARTEPYAKGNAQHLSGEDDRMLLDWPQFAFACATHDFFQDRKRWIIPLGGTVRHEGESAAAGDCVLVPAGARVESESARMLIGATGPSSPAR